MKQLAPIFCQRALEGTQDLPPAERADLYAFASHVLSLAECKVEAEAAHCLANDLRNTEAAQRRFDELLSAAAKVN